MDLPIAVIIDCCHKSFSSESADNILLRDLTASDVVPIKMTCSANVFDVYPLRLETKYYSAEIGLCSLRSPTIGDKEFADSVEAVIFWLSDCANPDSLSSIVDPWLSYVNHWEQTAVKLLVCSRSPSGSSIKKCMQQWCVKNDVELVELDPDDEAVSEAQDCGELTGVGRILQALKAHSWSNLEMKDERAMDADRAERLRNYLQENASPCDDTIDASKTDQQCAGNSSTAEAGCRASNLNSQIDQLLGEADQFSAAAPISENASFEQLFSKFAAMKATADSLPPEERKAYAERVTVAFWRAIGGDEGEISGSDDDADDKA